ncbi:hypothetical protein NJB1728216S_34300, partial [Mycobacterium marinum]
RCGDGLLEVHWVAHVDGPVLGVEGRAGFAGGAQVRVGGGDDRDCWGPRRQIR